MVICFCLPILYLFMWWVGRAFTVLLSIKAKCKWADIKRFINFFLEFGALALCLFAFEICFVFWNTPFPHVYHKGASSTFSFYSVARDPRPLPSCLVAAPPSPPFAEMCSSPPSVVLVRHRRTCCFVPPSSSTSSFCLSVCQPPAEAAALAARVSADADHGDYIVSDLEGIIFLRLRIFFSFLFVFFASLSPASFTGFCGHRLKLWRCLREAFGISRIKRT